MALILGPDITTRVGLSVSQFQRTMDAVFNQLHVALPGVVQSFDASTQTAQIQLAINQSVDVNGQLKNLSFPLLHDVPVVLPRAGGFSLTMPITAGTEVLVIFADLCIDSWFESGGTNNNQASTRQHSLSDAFAFVGTSSQPNVLSNYSTSSTQLRSDDGQTVIDVANGTVTVKASTVNVQSTNATVQASSSATVKASGTLTLEGDSGIVMKGNNNITLDGIKFSTHVHSGVQSGGETSGPPVG